jgi:hypothetical protein
MILALLLAAQSVQPEGFTPHEERAVVAVLECEKRFIDSVARRDRRRRGEALIGESQAACAGEEAALRTVLRTRFNAQATDRVVRLVRDTVREDLLRYIRRWLDFCGECEVGWFSKLLAKRGESADDPLVVVPVPPLLTLLRRHETAKGSPLTEAEVLDIRDNAVCLTMRRSRAGQLARSRGFPDIDPANAWEEWVRARSQGSA